MSCASSNASHTSSVERLISVVKVSLTAAIGILILIPASACRHRPPGETGPPHVETGHGEASFEFVRRPPASDEEPPRDRDFRAPIPKGELRLPNYPPEALEAGAGGGAVGVRICIGIEGRVTEIADSPLIPSSSGSWTPLFRDAVEEALRQWEFVPAVWEELEEGKDLDGDGLSDYRLVTECRPVVYYSDVKFDFRIVDGRGEVKSTSNAVPADEPR